MDWRKYFNVTLDVIEKAAGKGGKTGGRGYNPYRDEKGRFASHWGGKGFSHAVGAKVAGSSSGTAPFHTLSRSEQDSLVRRAIITQSMRVSEMGRFLNERGASQASDIAAIISQHTGSLQGKQLSRAVGDSLSRLQTEGLINVTRVERRGKMQGGHWAYADATTGNRVVNPITGKPMRGSTVRALGIDAKIEIQTSHAISLTTKGRNAAEKEGGGFTITQSLSNTRPTKFELDPSSTAFASLELRRKTFPNSQLGPQGRVHSNDKNAPELLKTKVSSITAAARKAGEKTLGETYPNHKWYDATSSARANVGAMTGNQELLDSVKLGRGGKVKETPAIATAKKLGIEHPEKPYYAILNQKKNGGTEITADDLDIGTLMKDKGNIKKVVKAVDTPRLYGGRPGQTILSTTQTILDKAGYGNDSKNIPTPAIKEKAKSLATKLVNNFDLTPIAKFEKGFNEVAKLMPDNFVYTNPINGFKMAFQKHDMVSTRVALKDQNGNPFKISIRTPGEVNTQQSKSSAMPLFVQSFDAAVKDEVAVRLKNVMSKHDAFAITSTSQLPKLRETVASAYTKIHKADPINDLARQMKAQLARQIGSPVRVGGSKRTGYKYKTYTKAMYDKQVKQINDAVKRFPGFVNGRPPSVTIPPNTDHLEFEKSE
jgi:hypothetical protein